ncbi:hypothetical protein B0H17DRAFT_1198745 [Mycena rosella]|uniref:Uncharacterized protein n=1 Tax=Mycena rosella TaxID=1033263 RepID=A0AAD7DM77_MYCRO|nr:hypothetical protein B0H17DRAFT_1198745 [Mycena rosella]
MIHNIIDLLDDLDLDIQGFEDASPTPSGSLLFPFGFYGDSEASTSAVDVASPDGEFESPTFEFEELLEEIELGPRMWVAAAPPIWESVPERVAVPDTPLCRTFRSLTIDVPPRTSSRTLSRSSPKENVPSPTERAFARLRDRGSSLALRALNSALASPEIRQRVSI